MLKVKNAIILAAGRGQRINNLTKRIPKPLLAPKNKILIEEIIKKLQEKKINDICIVVGYKSRKFNYLKNKYSIQIVKNKNWKNNNNITSIDAIKNRLNNTIIVNGDIVMRQNVFKTKYPYSLTYVEKNKKINEWWVRVNKNNKIDQIIKDGSSQNGFFQREITFIDKEMGEIIRKNIANFNKKEYYEIFILELSKIHNLPFGIQEIKKNCIFDIDTIVEYNKYKNE